MCFCARGISKCGKDSWESRLEKNFEIFFLNKFYFLVTNQESGFIKVPSAGYLVLNDVRFHQK